MEQEKELLKWKNLVIRFVNACEIDGFGHVKDIHAGDATAVYHDYLELINEQ